MPRSLLKALLLPLAAILPLAAPLAPRARADWTLTRADFSRQQQLTVNTWTPDDGLSVTGPGGNLIKVPTRDVVSLASDRRPAPNVKDWRLLLRNGDSLFGEPVAFVGQSLQFNVAELGPIDIPLKSVDSLLSTKPNAHPAKLPASDKDVVKFANGDQLSGLVASVDNAKLQISTGSEADGGLTDVAMNLVDQISFGGATPPRAIPPLSVRLTLSAGSVLTVPLKNPAPGASPFSWTINDITFLDPAGAPHKIPADAVVKIDLLGGRVVYLTELDPAGEQQSTFIGSHWPAQFNHNALGGPLALGDTSYPQGIGVHTRSALTYTLDGSFDTLRFIVGIDASAAARGQADVSVLLDGKTAWEQKRLLPLPATSTPTPVSLPLNGAKQLILRADPVPGSGNLDVMGRVDWVDIALIRP